MSEAYSQRIQSLIHQAFQQIHYGDSAGAIESLKEVLGMDPNHAYAHSILALVLTDQKRLYAAEIEAGIGLELEPEMAFSHFVMGQIYMARQKLKQALSCFEHARSLDPRDHHILLRMGVAYLQMGDAKRAFSELEKAVELAPDDPECHSELGDWCLKQGQHERARAAYAAALEIEPGHADALIGMGFVLLHDGKHEEAREHAIWVLQSNSMNESALRLLSAVKAKQSIWLGLWWRFNSWVTKGSATRIIVILVGMYALYRLSTILLKHSAYSQYQDVLMIGWLLFVIYTWVAPTSFMKSVKKELETVKLNPNF